MFEVTEIFDRERRECIAVRRGLAACIRYPYPESKTRAIFGRISALEPHSSISFLYATNREPRVTRLHIGGRRPPIQCEFTFKKMKNVTSNAKFTLISTKVRSSSTVAAQKHRRSRK